MPARLRSVDGGHSAGGARPIPVVLADGHSSMRLALRALLEREEDVEVVAEAGDFVSTLGQVAAHRPKVLVLDVHMPAGSGLERIQCLHERAPRTEIVVITMYQSPIFADQVLGAGARGFVLKDTAELDLAAAVRQAARQREYRSPRVRHRQQSKNLTRDAMRLR